MTESNFPQGNLNPQQPSPVSQPLNTEPPSPLNVPGQEQYPAGQVGNYTYPQAGAPATDYTNTAYTPAPVAPAVPNPQPTVPYQQTNYAANPYEVNPYGAAYVPQRKTNGWAIAGFICAFFPPLLGLIFSIIGLNKAKEWGNGKGLSIAGIIIASLNMFLGVLLAIFDNLYYL